jgi:hypothetical protein
VQVLMGEPTLADFHLLGSLRNPGKMCHLADCSHPSFQKCPKCGRHTCIQHLVCV